eukprot:scaffold1804_cov263-Pinguiococcus_pyrenoidosus.AAC.28
MLRRPLSASSFLGLSILTSTPPGDPADLHVLWLRSDRRSAWLWALSLPARQQGRAGGAWQYAVRRLVGRVGHAGGSSGKVLTPLST